MAATSTAPLRPAHADDVEELASLWYDAFGSRGPAERSRELREGMTYGTLADCWVVRDRGRIAGALRSYTLTLHARGRSWPVMGLAGVAVAPDFRRRGLARRMCVHALRLGRERGCALAALYPFRASFYADLGFGLVGTLLRHRFPPAHLPLYPGWERVERAAADSAEVRAVYLAAAHRSTGLIERSDRAWRFLADPRASVWLHRDPEAGATGYAVTRVRRSSEGQRLRVVELVALDRSAHDGLLGWMSAQRDQFDEVVYDALPGEAIDRRLRHPRRAGSGRPRGLWMDTASVLRGPMLRLLDPAAVQNGAEGAAFGLLDTELPEIAGLWRGGRRTGGMAEALDGERVLGSGEAAERFLTGVLPGQPPPPERWAPIPFGEEFRLLDEF